MKRLLLALALLASPLAAQVSVPYSAAPGRFLGPFPSVAANVQSMPAASFCPNAKADGVTDDWGAIQCAVLFVANTLNGGLRGGRVFAPCGNYRLSRTLSIPVAVNDQAVVLTGESERCVQFSFFGATTNFTAAPVVPALVLFGCTTPDNSGSSACITQFVGIENIQIDGSGLTGAGSVRGLQFTEAQSCWAENVLIKSLPNSSTGIYLRGSTVTGGLGGQTRPETRECHFINLMTDATIGSGANARPSAIIFQNADENNFYDCIFGITPGLTSVGNDSIFVVNFKLGRQNRFYGVLIAGDITANKTQYVAEVFGPPQGEDNSSQGSVLQNQTYGDWIEGFDIGLWNRTDGSGNTTGNVLLNPNIVVTTTIFKDDNNVFRNGQGGFLSFVVVMPGLGPPDGPVNYWGGTRGPYTVPNTFASLNTTPDVSGGNVFFFQDASANTVTNFLNPKPGQFFTTCASTANTTIASNTNIVLRGGANVKLPVNGCINFVYDGQLTFNRYEVSRTFGHDQILFQASGLTTTSTSDVSVTNYTLGAAQLNTNAQAVRLTMRGSAVTQNGVPNIKFGATVLCTATITAANVYELDAIVTRTGATAQIGTCTVDNGTALAVNTRSTPTETLSGTLVIDFRGSVVAGGTLNVDYAQVEYMAIQ